MTMNKNGLKNVPIGILLIASFYIFGAFILLIGVFNNVAGVRETVARAHGLLPSIGTEIVLAIAALALLLAYGLIRVSRWGYILTVSYSVFLCLVNLINCSFDFTWTPSAEKQISFGNFLFSALVIIYLLIVRKRFFEMRSVKYAP
jgi:hypothetical protein